MLHTLRTSRSAKPTKIFEPTKVQRQTKLNGVGNPEVLGIPVPHAHYTLCSLCPMSILLLCSMPIIFHLHYASCLLCSMPITCHPHYVPCLLMSSGGYWVRQMRRPPQVSPFWSCQGAPLLKMSGVVLGYFVSF